MSIASLYALHFSYLLRSIFMRLFIVWTSIGVMKSVCLQTFLCSRKLLVYHYCARCCLSCQSAEYRGMEWSVTNDHLFTTFKHLVTHVFLISDLFDCSFWLVGWLVVGTDVAMVISSNNDVITVVIVRWIECMSSSTHLSNCQCWGSGTTAKRRHVESATLLYLSFIYAFNNSQSSVEISFYSVHWRLSNRTWNPITSPWMKQ